jgi:hypothetical protein
VLAGGYIESLPTAVSVVHGGWVHRCNDTRSLVAVFCCQPYYFGENILRLACLSLYSRDVRCTVSTSYASETAMDVR